MTVSTESIDQISAALAVAQGQFQNPSKDASNPHFKSKYANLASGLNAVRTILSENGIAIIQLPRMLDDIMVLDTRLCHKSGQWIESSYPVCKLPAKQQEIGSALTYSRRYSLFAMLAIVGDDDDDDGNEASKRHTPAPFAPFSAEESRAHAESMMSALELCGSSESLKQWALANKPIKDRLTSYYQERVGNSYKTKSEEIKALDSAPTEQAA